MMISFTTKTFVSRLSWLYIIGLWWNTMESVQHMLVDAAACGPIPDPDFYHGCWFTWFVSDNVGLELMNREYKQDPFRPMCIRDRDKPIDLFSVSMHCDEPSPKSYSAILLGPRDMRMTIEGEGFYVKEYESQWQPQIYNWIPGDYLFQYTFHCGPNQTGVVESSVIDRFTFTGYCDEEVPGGYKDIILYQQERPKIGKNDTSPSYELHKTLSEDNMTICLHANRKVNLQYFLTAQSSVNDFIEPSSVSFTLVGPKNMRYKHTENNLPYLLYGNPPYSGLAIDDIKKKSWHGRFWRLGSYSLTIDVNTFVNLEKVNFKVTRTFTVSEYC